MILDPSHPRRALGGRSECAGGRGLVHHAAGVDADRHGRARRQHHLDDRVVSRPDRDGRDRARDAEAPPGLSFRALFVISLVGGALGGLILLATPSTFFAKLVPWLVLFATVVFAWGSFFGKPPADGQREAVLAPGRM